MNTERHIGLPGAIGVGVGAIVGGGILALAGVALATTGPGAIVAFALNGVIALLTALSFAELAASFPQSGGTYTFAKKVLSVRAAFTVGWVVWFASIVAAVLYALGFGAFAIIIINESVLTDHGSLPYWLNSPWTVKILAIGAILIYTHSLIRQTGGGGQWANIGKVAVFGILVVGGFVAFSGDPSTHMEGKLTPFFPNGSLGLIQAMGYTFIALQGFDLIAAVGGEIKNPGRNIPRAMLISLGIALTIYLPLLFLVSTVGMAPGESVTAVSEANPESIIAVAAENYLGRGGYWLVLVAGILSMLSALQANLFAASRVALSMARDRTLPHRLEKVHSRYGTPIVSIWVTAVIVIMLVMALPDVAAAGAASSLIFLLTFALAHLINVLARRRNADVPMAFKIPYFPLVPAVGGLACIGLAVFQGLTVLAAGLITGIWLLIGLGLYLSLFARRARVVDAAAEALDPNIVRLRGRSPLVLVPIANPENAEAMVFMAHALAPPKIGRVLLLNVVTYRDEWDPDKDDDKLVAAQQILRHSLRTSLSSQRFPEALTTIAPDPWEEIANVAITRQCESLLVGLTNFAEKVISEQLENLIMRVECDVVVLQAKKGWELAKVHRILVPIGGEGDHDELRARILNSLWRGGERQVTYLRVIKAEISEDQCVKYEKKLLRIAREEVPGDPKVTVLQNDNPAEAILEATQSSDLIILGLPRVSGKRVFGDFTLSIARESHCPVVMIGHKG